MAEKKRRGRPPKKIPKTTPKSVGPEEKKEVLTIPPPNLQVGVFNIRGTSPYMQNQMGEKARQQMHEAQIQGHKGKKGKARDPKDFMECYRGAMRMSTEGWHGIHAAAFRNAMISACRIVGFQMTRAKLSIFILPDGFDKGDGSPLVKIIKGEPEYNEAPTRNDSGVVDLRPRPLWREWECKIRVEYDADQFGINDVANLVLRAGRQVGVGEGRHDSKKSNGLGYGCFEIKGQITQ